MNPLPPEILETDPDVADLCTVISGEVDSIVERDDVEIAARELPWRPLNDAAAEWAMRKYVAAEERIARARDQAAQWHAQIDRWLADVTRRDAATAAVMAAHLERYALDRAETCGCATLRLPSGDVPTRDLKPHAVIRDEDAFVAWAVEHMPDAVRATYRPLVTIARQHVTIVERETGRSVAELACGHCLTTSDPVTRDDQVLCRVCNQTAQITRLTPEVRSVAAMITGDGEVIEVPGMDVDPGGRRALAIRPRTGG